MLVYLPNSLSIYDFLRHMANDSGTCAVVDARAACAWHMLREDERASSMPISTRSDAPVALVPCDRSGLGGLCLDTLEGNYRGGTGHVLVVGQRSGQCRAEVARYLSGTSPWVIRLPLNQPLISIPTIKLNVQHERPLSPRQVSCQTCIERDAFNTQSKI